MIILLIIFGIALLTNLIGIWGTVKKSQFYLSIFEIFTVLVTVIFFTSGLILCGIWTAIGLCASLIMIGLLLVYQPVSEKRTQAVTTGENAVQNYNYLDNNPPDYNSIVFHKPLSPPEYQSVELMPVHPILTHNRDLQKY